MTHLTDAELDEIKKYNVASKAMLGKLHSAARDRNRLEREIADLRERCALELDKWMNLSELRLHCGEIPAQEARTVLAVLRSRAAAIRALPLTKEGV